MSPGGGRAIVAASVVAAFLATSFVATTAVRAASPSPPASPPKSDGAMRDTLYPAARAFVRRCCASCHSDGGDHPKHERAYRIMKLDTYADWRESSKVILAVIDKRHLDGKIMPPPGASAQPSDAERLAIVQWIERGSPNTIDGK